ncbi:MAG: hypothetical protein AAFX78_05060 [Cyanobacteria bacterium J06638_20]
MPFTYGRITRFTLSYADQTNPLIITLQVDDSGMAVRNTKFADQGLIKTLGTLTLTSQAIGNPSDPIPSGAESLDPRLNPDRWQRGAYLEVEIQEGGEWFRFCRGALRILQQPVPPVYRGAPIRIEIGCDLAYLDSLDPPSGLATAQRELLTQYPPTITDRGVVGTVPRTAAINKLGSSISAPELIDDLPGQLYRFPNVDGSAIQQMGLLALAKGYYLWIDRNRDLRAIKLDPDRSPDLFLNVEADSISYRALQGAPIPPAKVEVTAHKTALNVSFRRRGGDRTIDSEEPIANQRITSDGDDDSGIVIVEKCRGSLFPLAFPGSLTLITASRSETQDTYTTIDGTEVLTGRDTKTRAPKGLILPNVYNADTELMDARRELWYWEVRDGQVVTESLTIFEPAQLVLPEEEWPEGEEDVLVVSRQEHRQWDRYKEGYAKTESFTDVKTGESNTWVEYSNTTNPPAPQIKPTNEPEIEPVTAETEYESREEDPKPARLRLKLQIENDADLQDIANTEGALTHGRSQPVQWQINLPSLFNTFYQPGLVLEWVEPNGVTGRYLADGDSFALTRDTSLYGADGLLLGTVSQQDSQTVVTPPYRPVPKATLTTQWRSQTQVSIAFQGEATLTTGWGGSTIGRAPSNGSATINSEWSGSTIADSSGAVYGSAMLTSEWSGSTLNTQTVTGSATIASEWSSTTDYAPPISEGAATIATEWAGGTEYAEPSSKAILTTEWSGSTTPALTGSATISTEWGGSTSTAVTGSATIATEWEGGLSPPAGGSAAWMSQFDTDLLAAGASLSDVSSGDRTALESWLTTAIANNWIASTPAAHDNSYPVYEFYPFAGDTLTTALVKLVRESSKAATLTNTGFVSGDYSRTTGITGDGSSRLGTGVTPSTDYVDATQGLIGAYVRSIGVVESAVRHTTTATTRYGMLTFAGQWFVEIYSLSTPDRVNDSPAATGWIMGNRNSNTNLELAYNGTVEDTTATPSGVLPDQEMPIFVERQASTFANFSTASLGCYALGGKGIATGDHSAFNGAIATLMTAFERNV